MIALSFPFVTIILFMIGGYMISKMDGFAIESLLSKETHSNPLLKNVIKYKGAWLKNYTIYKWTILFPITATISAVLVSLFIFLKKAAYAFFFNSISIACIIGTFGFSMFPFILPSSFHYNSSLTVWDASSSYTSLLIMLIVVIIFMPIVLFYVSWVYKMLIGKIKESYIKKEDKNLY